MDKELKEMLKDLLKDLESKLDKRGDFDIKTKLEEASKEDTEISIKVKDGKAKTKIEGSGLALLITLAGLEKTLLKKLNPPKGIYDIVKQVVDTEDVK